MKPTIKGIVFGYLLLLLVVPAKAQFGGLSKTGLSAATFLSIEVGPRAKAMGGAFVAVADDVSALYWNPSGITRLEGNQLMVAHTEWLAEINHDFVGIALPLGNLGVLGFSLTSVTMPDMLVRTVLQPEGTGERFNASDIAIAGTYAKKLTTRFAIGGSLKYIRQKIFNSTSSTAAVDFGMLFRTPFRSMDFGMSISNFGGDLVLSGTDTEIEVDVAPEQFGNNDRILANLTTEKFQLPLTLRVGLAMNVMERSQAVLRLAVDGVVPNDNSQYVNIGAELLTMDAFALRGGYRTLFLKDSEEGLTLGAGVMAAFGNAGITADYAYSRFGILENVHEIALTIRF